MRVSDLMRYVLWGGIVATADANRREYHMATTWLPHLLTNTFTLLLPDLYRLLIPQGRDTKMLPPLVAEAEQTLSAMIRDNAAYVVYVLPLAAGYILSHPRFNIYKGDLAKIQLAGFGLDAIPHSATAAALTTLICDTVDTASTLPMTKNILTDVIHESSQAPAATSGVILALVTLWWEVGEYLIYRHEMASRGDMSKINMQWSLNDTLHDCVSNFTGWAVAMTLRSVLKSQRKSGHEPIRT
ncbi:MAG: hypothetical protein ABI947_02765 [Chloroflexota bacterium]